MRSLVIEWWWLCKVIILFSVLKSVRCLGGDRSPVLCFGFRLEPWFLEPHSESGHYSQETEFHLIWKLIYGLKTSFLNKNEIEMSELRIDQGNANWTWLLVKGCWRTPRTMDLLPSANCMANWTLCFERKVQKRSRKFSGSSNQSYIIPMAQNRKPKTDFRENSSFHRPCEINHVRLGRFLLLPVIDSSKPSWFACCFSIWRPFYICPWKTLSDQ
jgi:hypothetical protein